MEVEEAVVEAAAVAVPERISQLKVEGEAVIARRAGIAEAMAAAAAAAAAPLTLTTAAEEELVGTVTPTLAIFESFDTDQSGSLSLEELKAASVAAGRPSDEATIQQTMEELDTNRDGVISLEEFTSAPRELAWWEKVY